MPETNKTGIVNCVDWYPGSCAIFYDYFTLSRVWSIMGVQPYSPYLDDPASILWRNCAPSACFWIIPGTMEE